MFLGSLFSHNKLPALFAKAILNSRCLEVSHLCIGKIEMFPHQKFRDPCFIFKGKKLISTIWYRAGKILGQRYSHRDKYITSLNLFITFLDIPVHFRHIKLFDIFQESMFYQDLQPLCIFCPHPGEFFLPGVHSDLTLP